MLIDRDNLLARIDRCVSEAGKDAAQVMAIRDIKAMISVMPEVHRKVKVTPVVHGYWDDSFDGITPFCSACHMSHRGFDRTPNYCPNCGAKMDLEETKDNGTDNP